MLELVSNGRPAAERQRAFADRRHYPPDHEGLSGRSEARLRAGLSAGGAAAATMGGDPRRSVRGRRDLFRPGLRRGPRSSLSAMRQGGGKPGNSGPTLPTIVFHGDRDTTVHPNNGDRIVEQSARAARSEEIDGRVPDAHRYTRAILPHAERLVVSEHCNIHGAGHAWSGGSPAGSYTNPRGPDATREILH